MSDHIKSFLWTLIKDNPSSALLGLAFSLALVRYLQLWHHNRTYWSSRGVRGEKPLPIFSALHSLFIEDRQESVLEKTRKYGKVHGSFMLGSPCLYVADAEVFRQIAIKDFDSFQNHSSAGLGSKYQQNALLWLRGDHWKRVRALMTPTFTSGKIKRMHKLLHGCANDLVDNFREQCEQQKSATGGGLKAQVDLMATYSLYTMDGITTCGYGLKLQRQKGDIDTKSASTRNKLVKDISGVLGFKLSRIGVSLVAPSWLLRLLHFKIVPESTFQPVVDRLNVLIERRRQGNEKYDDLLQSLVDAKIEDQLELNEMDDAENHHAGLSEHTLREDRERLLNESNSVQESATVTREKSKATLNDLEIIASAIFLMAAGLDTTRASMSTITYLLAHNQDVQERLFGELSKIAKRDEQTGLYKFDYDDLTACKYLDAVISESLRFFGPSAKTDRVANADYFIEKYNIRVPCGTKILLGMRSLAMDPDYWEEPRKFNPERFMPGQREHIVPGSYAPFSLGPRHCLGMRFSLTETKLGIAKVLMELKFDPAPGTVYPPLPTRGISLVAIKDCRVLVTPRRKLCE